MVRRRSRQRQGGQELVEFSLTALLLAVLLVGSFISGMNLMRSIRANQSCRDVANMYIHGADFSTYSMQQLAQRLAQGLNLQIGASFSGNSASNTGNQGNVVVTLSRVMYVGSTSEANCAAVGASHCTNSNSFVFTQRIQFGNGSLTGTKPSSLGNPTTSAISSAGVVASPVTDAGAKLPTTQQTSFSHLWQTALQDGQVCYVVEFYARSPDLTLGSFAGGGVFARSFF
jgi:hypothetical protein